MPRGLPKGGVFGGALGFAGLLKRAIGAKRPTASDPRARTHDLWERRCLADPRRPEQAFGLPTLRPSPAAETVSAVAGTPTTVHDPILSPVPSARNGIRAQAHVPIPMPTHAGELGFSTPEGGGSNRAPQN